MTGMLRTLSAPPRTGVAMCVFNGVRFLREQLDSIAGQTQLPDRVAIIDDGSTDGSWEVLRQWAAEAPMPVTLHRNDSNVGVVRNFENAARMLLEEVDIVFFSDQDDAWFPGKLAAFVEAFTADSGLGLVHSDAELVNAAGKSLGTRLFAALRVTDRERQEVAAGRAWRAYVKRNLVTGAACACRSEVLARAMPFSPDTVHDDWISFTAALVSRVKLLPEPLMAYRLHGTNTIGLPIPGFRWWFRTVVHAVLAPQVPLQEKRRERLLQMRAHAQQLGAPADALACLDRAIEHTTHRCRLPRAFLRRWKAVKTQWRAGQYHEWSSGELSVLHDVLIAT
jgi:glycosyltransferase involved in cell wall biosynthesis